MQDKRLIELAKKELGLNIPYFRVEVDDFEERREVRFFTRSGVLVCRWETEQPVTTIAQPVPAVCNDDDIALIPGVGEVTKKKLHDHGLFTVAMLKQAWEVWAYQEMSRVLNRRELNAINKFVGFKEDTE
jgi:hypothetical protein